MPSYLGLAALLWATSLAFDILLVFVVRLETWSRTPIIRLSMGKRKACPILPSLLKSWLTFLKISKWSAYLFIIISESWCVSECELAVQDKMYPQFPYLKEYLIALLVFQSYVGFGCPEWLKDGEGENCSSVQVNIFLSHFTNFGWPLDICWFPYKWKRDILLGMYIWMWMNTLE